MNPDYIQELDAESSAVIFIPPPHGLWREDDTREPCPTCQRVRRLASYTLQTAFTRACHECLASRGFSQALATSLQRVFLASESGWTPSDPRASLALLGGTPEAALESLISAVEIRHYMTTQEVLALGHRSMSGTLRRLSQPAKWMLDPSLPPEDAPPHWVRVIIETLDME